MGVRERRGAMALALVAAVVCAIGLGATGARASVLEGEAGFCVAASQGGYADSACTLPTAPGAGAWEWTPAAGRSIQGTDVGKRNLIESDDAAGEVECHEAHGLLRFSGAAGLTAELGFGSCLEGEDGCGEGASLRHGGRIDPTLVGVLEETAKHEVRFTVPNLELAFECVPAKHGFFIDTDPSSKTLGEANKPIPANAFQRIELNAHTHELEGASQVVFKPQLEFSTPFELRTHVPAVEALSPDSGASTGGTSVTLTGLYFEEVTGVSFGSSPASSYTVESPTRITAVAPAGTGQANVIVTNAAGASAGAALNEFSYAPVVKALAPAFGPAAGGTVVTITGEKLDEATGVQFGARPAASWEILSPEAIRATAPASESGELSTVDVRVQSATGTSAATVADRFEYLPVPRVEKVSPNKGPASGGTPAIVEGWGFRHVAEVWFGGVPASSFTVTSWGRIEALAPPNVGATVNVLVTTGGGTSAPGGPKAVFKYGKPEVARVTPSAGPLAGGAHVTIEGSGFATGAGTTILFKKTPATAVSCESTTLCTATAPAGAKLGSVDVIAVVGAGKSRKSPGDRFTYE